MNSILLQRKFLIPTDGQLFHRPELIESLNNYSRDPLTVINAPAGYGKTSLVCDWLQYAQHPVYWLSLDEQNNLPSSFWLYFYSCLQRIDRDLDDKVLQMLNNHFIEDYSLICDLTLASLEKLSRKWNRPSRVVIVLDDFHHIDHRQILQPLNRFLDYMPDWLQIIITCREIPRLMLPNRCSKAKAHIIGASELRFNAQQVADFLRIKLGLNLLEEDLQVISNQTEGWAAAIQLTGLALKAGSSLEDCIKTRDTLLADFLFDEIFSQLPPDHQQLLSDACIVEYFDLELCQRFNTERENESILQVLMNQGLFISRMSDQSSSFRIHSLFRQWLQEHTIEDPQRLSRNQKSALSWLEDKKDYHQALELSIILEDWHSCSETMKLLYPSLVNIHHFDHVSSILNRIPESIIISLPHFCLLKALLHFSQFQYENAEKYTSYIEAYFSSTAINSHITDQEKTSILMGSRILQAQMARFSGQADKASLIQKNIELSFQDINHDLQCWLIYGKAIDLFLADNIQNSIPYFKSALESAKKTADGLCVISTLGWLLHALYHNGQIQQGIQLAESYLLWLHKFGLQHLPNISSIYAALVTLYLEDNQLQKAWHNYSHLIENINDFTEPREIIYNKFHTHFNLLTSTGRYKEAHTCIQQLESYEHQFGHNVNSNFSLLLDTQVLNALLELRQGNSFPLLQISLEDNSSSSPQSDICQFRHYYERMIMATRRLIMTTEESEDFSQLAHASLTNGNLSRAVTCHLIPAKILCKQGQTQQALQHFKYAITISIELQFTNLFIEDEVNILPLIQLALNQDMETIFCQKLLSAIQARQYFNDCEGKKGLNKESKKEGEAPNHSTEKTIHNKENFHQFNQVMIESLSPRELEVLGLINQGERNKQIAEKLTISISTVKRHLQNIYQKLQVSSRTEAIAILNSKQ